MKQELSQITKTYILQILFSNYKPFKGGCGKRTVKNAPVGFSGSLLGILKQKMQPPSVDSSCTLSIIN